MKINRSKVLGTTALIMVSVVSVPLSDAHALKIGGSVGRFFEKKVKPIVKPVVKPIVKLVKPIVKKVIKKPVQAVGKGAEHLANESAKLADKGARKLGNAGRNINSAAIDAGHGVNDAAIATGKGAEHFTHEVGRSIDKTGREIGTAGRDINSAGIDVGHYVEEHPFETALYIGMAATTGLVIADLGTVTLVLGAGGGGVAIALYDSSDDSTSDTSTDPSDNGSISKAPSSMDAEEFDEYLEVNREKTEVFPYYKRDGRFDFRLAKETYRHEFGVNWPLDRVEIALPTLHWEIRQPNDRDKARGDFFASRKIGVPGVRRNHGGFDFVTDPGEVVVAPISGYVERYKNPGKPGLVGIRIVSPNGFAADVFYVEPSEQVKRALAEDQSKKKGMTTLFVKAGDPIGVAQDIRPAYGENMTNHVHVTWQDPAGRAITPDGKYAREPMPPAKPQVAENH